MEKRKIWINLPVKDMKRSKTFFRDLNFKENERHREDEEVGSFLLGELDLVIMLFPEAIYEKFSGISVADTSKGSEILLNLEAKTKMEVDQFARLVADSGGEIFSPPKESEGWMYGFGFKDPDGHRWSMLYMDPNKAPK